MSPSASHYRVASTKASHDEEPLVESDPGADMDEPPDPIGLGKSMFERRNVRGVANIKTSLLTQALRDDDFSMFNFTKRPSMASNLSIASTAELTCDTGETSPTRAPTPSPPHPGVLYILDHAEKRHEKDEAHPITRPRRISFACAEPPKITQKPASPSPPKAPEPQRRPTIKFACPAPPKAKLSQPTQPQMAPSQRKTSIKFTCTEKPRVNSIPAPTLNKPMDQDFSRRASAPAPDSKNERSSKFLEATSDLRLEGSRFHEFASDEQHPDDWIIEDSSVPKSRLTMSDVLAKEKTIQKLGKEALEDDAEDDLADEEDCSADAADDEDNSGDDADDDGDSEEFDANEDDGFNSDVDHDSDDEELDLKEDEEVEVAVPVWAPQDVDPKAIPIPGLFKTASFASDCSSIYHNGCSIPTRRVKIGRGQTTLPDSTDFVCGTFDEDRVAEDIYMTAVAARTRSKLHAIPQDIDPSFPASDPEDEGEGLIEGGARDNDELDLAFGEPEGVVGQPGEERRRRRSDASSFRSRLRSPPPKKLSPPPKVRGRSPRPLFGRSPARRLQSPLGMPWPKSPQASPVHKVGVATCKPLASRPVTTTKSLPRPAGIFPAHLKARRKNGQSSKGAHRRGAIDIVKGLEQKRQRRREKYIQKYCDRARKGQNPEKKPVLPGQGVERMRELGLFMAGKLGPGYVLSF